MPKITNILKHVEVATAKARRKCSRCGSKSILKGDLCLEVYDKPNRRNYCVKHAAPILRLAGTRLKELEVDLEG